MKEKLQKAVLVAVSIAIGITLVTILNGETFSCFKTGLYAVVAFVVDYIFSCIFEKRKH